ncbi:MAG: tetratricopeptide repeat protein [Micavibrio aeruginosavorus]|uniref:Tetratricopeptide repeat protein n=1 Tax=Micavibrio aeruginosavorus TaxID=349221 RepID=A0A7T5R3T1_9BACT|nr:MAG: tetratricopeptide repeat protein [Micavibrio aeruginosavorus]
MPLSNEVPLDDALQIAAGYHRQNNLVLADRTYRDILKAAPDHFDALHNLAIVCYQRGRLDEAARLIRQAYDAGGRESDAPHFWNNYAVMMAETGQPEAALAGWDRAVELDPDFVDALSSKANALWKLERYQEAEALCRRALALQPDMLDARLNLGNALVAQGKREEALSVWQDITRDHPKFAHPWNNIGNALRDQGKLAEAEAACRKALELDPKLVFAMNNLGNVLRDQGKPKEAEEWFRKAVSLKPDYAEAQNNLGVALLDQQRYEEAATAIRYAIAFKPDYGDAHGNLCLALMELGEIEDAQEHAQKAILLKPASAQAYAELSDVLFAADRIDEAEAALEEALRLEPDSPRVYLKLATVMERANRIEDALAAIDKAVALNPEMPEAYLRKGITYFLSNRVPEAIEAINKALALKPDMALGYATLAEIEQSEGDIEASVEYVRKGLSITRDLPSLFYSLGKAQKYKADSDDFRDLCALEEGAEKRGTQYCISLYFALANACEDIGDYKKSFIYLKKGNDAKRRTVSYNHELCAEGFKQIRETYSRQTIDMFAGKGCPSDIPVFIVGMPRSGTTLTEQIISSHPDVFGAGELMDLTATERQCGALHPENAAAFGQTYVDMIRARDPSGGAKRITDKMPGNYSRIGEIICTLPNAKIIHCRRDPVDTCLSCYKQLFARGQYWSYNLEELAAQYKLYEELMAHWRSVVPERFIEIDYEDTVNNLEAVARRLIDYIGLPWDDACLKPHEQKRTVLTASKMQVIKPVYKTSVKSWKRYEEELQPLIRALDYKEA